MGSRSIASDGRLWILLAAVLWSLSGIWTKSLPDEAMTIAVWRSIFAGLVLLPLVRTRTPARLKPRHFLVAVAFVIDRTTKLTTTFASKNGSFWYGEESLPSRENESTTIRLQPCRR